MEGEGEVGRGEGGGGEGWREEGVGKWGRKMVRRKRKFGTTNLYSVCISCKTRLKARRSGTVWFRRSLERVLPSASIVYVT